MKKRILSVLLTFMLALALTVSVAAAETCTVKFTCPSDVVVRVAKGFSAGVDDGGTEITNTSVSADGDLSTYVFTLEAGNYRFLAQDVAGPTSDKYYNWDKNFVVTAADVAAGEKTIDADPGLLANTGWEQKRDTAGYYVRQYTDEVLASEAATVSDELKEKYAYVFTTPTFTVEGKARHQFTTQTEMEEFVAALDEKTDYMTTFVLGQTKKNYDLRASVYTTEDLTGMTLEQAAAAVQSNGKPTILIHAQMHGDEQSGTEGALATIALLCDTYGAEAIETVNIIVIPRVNPDGSEIYKYESGGTSYRNINRDSMQLTQPETKILVNTYNLFEPEVCFDHHEYRATTESTVNHMDDARISENLSLNAAPELVDLQYEITHYLFDTLGADGLRTYYYRDGKTAGAPVTMKTYYSLRGSISLLAEIPGQRKGNQQWERRVLTQHLAARNLIDYVVANPDKVNETVAAAKLTLAKNGVTFDENNLIALGHDTGSAMPIKRYMFNLTNGTLAEYRDTTVYRYDTASHARPYPIYYVVPKSAAKIANVLSIADMHGIEYSEIGADEVMELRAYSGDYTEAALGEPLLYSFEEGAYKFPVAQELSAVLAFLMEPDNLDCQPEGELYKGSFVQQGNLTIDEIYRCENDSDHALSYVPEQAAACETVGYAAHYLCLCGKAFAANEHVDALAVEDYLIPATGHNFVQQTDSSFLCVNTGCGETAADLSTAVAACGGVGTVTLGSGKSESVDNLIIPAGVTVDLNGGSLSVAGGLTVNAGGALTNGVLTAADGAVVALNDNGGWVPVYFDTLTEGKCYTLYPIAAKIGQNIDFLDNGVKYAFGYKYENPYGTGHDAYGESVAANVNDDLKFGVHLEIPSTADHQSADYSFSAASIEKMSEVGSGADDFFKVNLSIIGDVVTVDNTLVSPLVKVKSLGFRCLGASYGVYTEAAPVAEFGGNTYTSLEAAVAAAEATGLEQDVKIIGDVLIKRPTTIKMNGLVRFMVNSGDYTVSGPLTLDGQNVEAQRLLFQCQDTGKLTLDGVTIENYTYTDSTSGYGGVFRVEDTFELTLDGVTIRNCAGARRGVMYVTNTPTVNITGCTFENNEATSQWGGVIAIYSSASVSVKDSSFTGNSAADHSGAIGVSQYNTDGTLSIENCSFTGNTAVNNGGAIYVKAGTLNVNGVTMSGNKLGSTANDIELLDGTLNLSGTVAIERIKLESGKTVALNDTLALKSGASPIVIDGTIGSVVLTGSKVADYYELFTGTQEDVTVRETGKLLGSVVYVAEVGGEQYESIVDAVAAANEAAASTASTVVVSIIGDETFTEPVTITPAANVQLSFTVSATLEGPLTIDGAELSRKIVPILIPNSTSTADGKTVTLKGVTIQNFWRPISTTSAGNYGAALRTNAYNTIVLDGATVTGNKAEIGGVYITSNGTLIVKNNSVISNNESLAGFNQGVIFLNGTSSSIVASDSTFSGNVGANRASVVAVIGAKSSFTNCTFENNSGAALGAIHVRNASTVLPITNCTFTNNTSTAANGAAIYSELGTTNVTNTTFSGNTQNVYIAGGTVTGVE